MVTVGDDPLLGMVVEGRYKIQSVIGQGSAGTVYKAVQELIGREVAIKVLHDYLVSDDEFIKRFRQEAKASSRLSHPNIITIYDFGVIPQGNRPYIAMDLLVGTPLSDLLAQEERLTIEESIPIFVQVCSALGEAHRQGVVHRDVKPENIVLVERSGQKLFPIVVDFGIARIVEESDAAKITRTGTVCGSPTYMSPEQCTSSKVDNRSDIYSLAVVIYECLTGDVPFHSEELVRVMAMHLSDPPTPLNQVRPGLRFPEALEEVVYRALAKSPDQRYQTMDEFAEALEESAKEPVKPAAKASSSQPPPPDIEPGPLAQDESLHSKRSSSQEVHIPQRSSTRDLASRALEELQQRDDEESSGPASAMEKQIAAMRAQMKSDQSDSQKTTGLGAGSFKKGRNTATPILQKVSAFVVGILALGLLAVTLHTYGGIEMPANLPSPFKKKAFADADALIKAGKLADAVAILETIDLSAAQQDTLDKCYLSLGKWYQKSEEIDKAIENLKNVDSDSPYGKEAKDLLK
ncbi:MAG: serine/threonine protein kinase, partial [Candidatus Obscuribacterales bacterium]|nr:serine/threonine protein kinase [Candidatus Obscuribacterales bacterium]